MALIWLQSEAVTLCFLEAVPSLLIYFVGHQICMIVTVVAIML